jgi:quercetin dioxygenase-like cupin family protein
MIKRRNDSTPVEMLPGLIRRTLVESESMMICEFTFEDVIELPVHTHPHEQVGYVISGRMRFTIEGKNYDLKPGDSYSIPSNVPHGAKSLEPTVAIDIFNPPREEYR